MIAIKSPGDLAQMCLLPITLMIVSLLNFCYLYTYPVNIAAFDYPNYAGMIFSGVSNLIHASGYALGARIALDTVGIPNGSDILDLGWLHQLQLIQFYFHLSTIFICTFICSKVFGRLSAALMCLAWGGSVFFMGGVNSIGPDWLQGDLLAITLITGLWAFKIDNHAKILLYTLSATVLTCAYLVKFNSLVIAPVIAILLICDNKAWIWKIVTSIVTCAVSLTLGFMFIESFHYPSTGTRQLSYDHAWVLIDAIPKDYITQDPNKLGINTLRWRALGSILPQDYFRAAAYQEVDWGAPKDIKAPYLEKYNYLMNASRADLVDFTTKNHLPNNFVMSVSAIPAYYYIGLPQADALGISVYKESLITQPLKHIERLVSGWSVFFIGKKLQLTPFNSDSLGMNIGKATNSEGNVKISTPEGRIPQHMLYWNPAEEAGYRGMVFFERLSLLTPPSWLYTLLALASCFAIFKTQNNRTIFSASMLALSIILLVSSSAMLLGVRFKEMLALLPILCIFLSIGFVSCISWCKKIFFNSNALASQGEPT